MRLARGGGAFVIAPLVIGAMGFIVAPWILAVGVGVSALCGIFFRDPDRKIASGIVAPADGKIMAAEPGAVVTFLNLHNVHVVRAPVAGRVTSVERFGRGHRPAFLKGAKRNAGVLVTMDTVWGEFRVKMIAGLLARRASAYVGPGADVAAGDRIGIIRFASRVDVAMPRDLDIDVAPGQRVKAGATRIAGPPGAEVIA